MRQRYGTPDLPRRSTGVSCTYVGLHEKLRSCKNTTYLNFQKGRDFRQKFGMLRKYELIKTSKCHCLSAHNVCWSVLWWPSKVEYGIHNLQWRYRLFSMLIQWHGIVLATDMLRVRLWSWSCCVTTFGELFTLVTLVLNEYMTKQYNMLWVWKPENYVVEEVCSTAITSNAWAHSWFEIRNRVDPSPVRMWQSSETAIVTWALLTYFPSCPSV